MDNIIFKLKFFVSDSRPALDWVSITIWHIGPKLTWQPVLLATEANQRESLHIIFTYTKIFFIKKNK
jgi:hypothetical protein